MAFSNSIRTAHPQHFEQIARNLLKKRRVGDYGTCDLRIELKNGYELVHSIVVCAYSRTIAMMLEKKRAPYQPIDMMQFDKDSVRRIIDWMYSGEIDMSGTYLQSDISVASYLKVGALQPKFEHQIKASNDIVMAINLATCSSFSVSDDTINELVITLSANLPTIDIGRLELASMIAIMSSLLPLKTKYPLINMMIGWVQMKKPTLDTIISISQSVVISDMVYEMIYTLRQSIQQYLIQPQLANKSQLEVSPSGQINLKIFTKSGQRDVPKYVSKTKVWPVQRSRSGLSMIEALPDPFVKTETSRTDQRCKLMRTTSEMEFVNALPDPFEVKTPATLRRETNGFPKLFTQSSVEQLRAMEDPFEKKSVVEQPAIKKELYSGRFQLGDVQPKRNGSQRSFNGLRSASEMDVIRAMPDPFGAVIMTPVRGCVTPAAATTSSTCSLKMRNKEEKSPTNYRTDFLVSIRSGPKKKSEHGLSTRASKKNVDIGGKWF